MKSARSHHGILAILVLGLALSAAGCSGGPSGDTRVRPITTMAEFEAAIGGSARPLVMVDFYATWCAPCKQLEPVIDALSVTYEDRVAVYKVDVDQVRAVLQRFGITAIPHVMFFKNGRPVKALPGLRPESAYENAIKTLS